jgi:hypothetical protein
MPPIFPSPRNIPFEANGTSADEQVADQFESDTADLSRSPQKTPPSRGAPIYVEMKAPSETHHGAEVLSILARASGWAYSARHAVVTFDHLLFGFTEEEVGARALIADGVVGVPDLGMELLHLLHNGPISALVEGSHPVIDNDVLAVLNHALGYARQNGRDTSNVSDLRAALFDAVRGVESPGIAALRRRWQRATETDETLRVLLEIKDAQKAQPDMIVSALANEVKAALDRVRLLEGEALNTAPTRSLPWYRRLNVLLFALGLISVVWGGFGFLSLTN